VHKIQGLDPIISGQLTRENIAAAEADPSARLSLCETVVATQKSQNLKGVGYTPMMHRKNRLGGILWIVKNYPEITDGHAAKLMRSTRATVSAIRNRTHKSYNDIHIQSPIVLGLISESALRDQLDKVKKK